MIKSLWNLFLAIIAKPAIVNDQLACVKNAPIKHYYHIPENSHQFTRYEIRTYAADLTSFILQKNGILN